MKMPKIRTSKKGFTLIELLIVVAIIGILAAIAIPQFAAYRKRAYCSAAKSDAKNLAVAAEAYYAINDAYPTKLAEVQGTAYGFQNASSGVTLTIAGNTSGGFTITSKHTNCDTTTTFDSSTGQTTDN